MLTDYSAIMLYASKGAHNLFTGQREREKEGEVERERERDVIELISLLLTIAELLFLFLKGMTGALAPFSYLVKKYCPILIRNL